MIGGLGMLKGLKILEMYLNVLTVAQKTVPMFGHVMMFGV
jgi:hypothetical protein